MAVWVKAVSGNNVKNNGATIPRGGNIDSSSTVTSAPDNVTQGAGHTSGTKPLQKTGSNIGTMKAVSSATFAGNYAGKYVVLRGVGSIHGADSYMLNSGAADFGRRSIHGKTNRRSYHITSWNYVTGAATKGSDTNDDMGADHAATPTRAIPGELVITDRSIAKSGALAVPLQTDYPEKTG